MKRMTLKESGFIEAYCSFDKKTRGNGVESARQAGYAGTNKVLKVTACRLLKREHLAAEIDKINAKAVKKADLSVEKVLRDLEDTREKAVAVGNYGAAVRCSELAGKYLKMFTDRVEHVSTLESVTTAELVTLLQEIAEQGNVDLSQLLEGNATRSSDLSDPAESPTTH